MVVFISEEEIETLKERLAKKDEKLKNQASELNHLTNEVIPELKKQNKELKIVKKELSEALETSTKKYFDHYTYRIVVLLFGYKPYLSYTSCFCSFICVI